MKMWLKNKSDSLLCHEKSVTCIDNCHKCFIVVVYFESPAQYFNRQVSAVIMVTVVSLRYFKLSHGSSVLFHSTDAACYMRIIAQECLLHINECPPHSNPLINCPRQGQITPTHVTVMTEFVFWH